MADPRVVLELRVTGDAPAAPPTARPSGSVEGVERMARRADRPRDDEGRPLKLHDIRPLPGTFDDPFKPKTRRDRALDAIPVDRAGRPMKLHDIRPLPGTFEDPFRRPTPSRPGPTRDDPTSAGLRASLSSMAAGGGMQGGIRAGLTSAASSVAGGAGLAGLAAAAGAATVAIGGLAVSVSSMRDAMESARFAPETAAALARREIRTLQSRREQAAELGPQLARLIELQTETSVAMREVRTEIAEAILPVLSEFFEVAGPALQQLASFLDWANDRGILEDLVRTLTLGPLTRGILAALRMWRDDEVDREDAQAEILRFLNPERQREIMEQRAAVGVGADDERQREII